MKIDDFINAAKRNNKNLIKDFLENGFDINTQDQYGFTAILEVAEFGHNDLFWYLIENGANIKIKANENFGIAHAIGLSGNKRMLDYIIKNGIDIYEKVSGGEQNGFSIIEYAKLGSNIEILNVLVQSH
ncbi:MAG: hypothetical protein A2015_04200 [Spirochaetes bacterium GWF1_31_7]|nr:MAG: hypothetical protein A2Y30_17070 [Spirochaetes bacterium GWE1_32_154]OHD47423.1 MAG: hypothetical protein A2Y29_10080 [Spirochaetes bacterium GWE2_31_10]OHD53000.1 MAG: hypothetical protein A2015_04200 [Spirochaetes bacterium GWF1_31_7]OHD79838.1 MAG: hypothetical protein A2355_11695 [Spirochaetes bacterium RIFOXYB1_FULL_32_8]HBD95757.1 ankyrin repeat domain-containing protein [Spirochaetia bacterium]